MAQARRWGEPRAGGADSGRGASPVPRWGGQGARATRREQRGPCCRCCGGGGSGHGRGDRMARAGWLGPPRGGRGPGRAVGAAGWRSGVPCTEWEAPSGHDREPRVAACFRPEVGPRLVRGPHRPDGPCSSPASGPVSPGLLPEPQPPAGLQKGPGGARGGRSPRGASPGPPAPSVRSPRPVCRRQHPAAQKAGKAL